MKRFIYSIIPLICIATGCEKNDSTTTPVNPLDQEVSLIPNITKITESPQLNEDGSGTFNDGDTFTLYAYDNAKGSSSIDYTIGSTNLFWRNLDFAEEGEAINFVACYPPQVLKEASFDFTVGQNTESDLLLAAKVQANAGEEHPVVLNFRHAMHRLAINFTIKDSSIEPESIETCCTAYATCKVYLPTGSLTQGEENILIPRRGRK